MTELSPENGRRLYEEETAGVDAREQIEQEGPRAKDEVKAKDMKKGTLGCLVVIALIVVVVIVSRVSERSKEASLPEFQQMPYTQEQAEAYQRFFLEGWSDVVTDLRIEGPNSERMTAELWIKRRSLASLSQETREDFIVSAVHEWWIRSGYEVVIRDRRTSEVIAKHLAEDGPRLLKALRKDRGCL